jgi:hypothetical protein
VKVRREGVGSHFCIHKHFYERSPLWQKIREEEMKASEDFQKSSQPPEEADAEPSTSGNASLSSLKFDSMDARHLSSLPLLRARVVKLLKASKNYIHESNNMLLRLVSKMWCRSLDILPYSATGLFKSHQNSSTIFPKSNSGTYPAGSYRKSFGTE